MAEKLFSQELSTWLKSKQSKTFGELETYFGEKSFAVAFLILMAPAALPLPTGGITHILEIITMLLSLELVFGRKNIWTPRFWRRRNLGKGLQTKALPKLVGFIGWFERWSHQRLGSIMTNGWFLRLVGLIVFVLALAALLAVPFSGMDTLPALGIIIISLSLILNDILITLLGLLTGIVGIFVEVIVGSAAWHWLHL